MNHDEAERTHAPANKWTRGGGRLLASVLVVADIRSRKKWATFAIKLEDDVHFVSSIKLGETN